MEKKKNPFREQANKREILLGTREHGPPLPGGGGSSI